MSSSAFNPSGGGGGASNNRQITQTAHGFAAGNVLGCNGTTYAMAEADVPAHSEVVGIVTTVIDANTFTLTTGGYITGLSGLVPGATYFLSPTTAGALTTTEPTTPGQASKPLLVADSSTSGYFFNWRGMQISAASGGGSGLTRSITQAAHGFAIGNLLILSGTTYVLAKADSAVNSDVVGMVTTVSDANNFILTTGGYVTGLSGLTAGTVYFLSPTTAGAITATEPTTAGQVSKPLLVADSTTSGYLFNYRGIVQGGSTPVNPGRCSGRLSLSSTLAIPTADISAATTLYYLPYRGNATAIYTGSVWTQVALGSGGYSLSLAGVVSGSVYDVYLDYNGGAPQLGLSAAWTNTTTRATALVAQDGVWCVGINTRRYLGTIYGSAAGQVSDTLVLRGVWNYANRVERKLLRNDTTANWTYSGSWRQANGGGPAPGNHVMVVVGVSEEPTTIQTQECFNCTVNLYGSVGIGRGNATPIQEIGSYFYNGASSNGVSFAQATFKDYNNLGLNDYWWLEYTNGSVGCTAGPVGGTSPSGIFGSVRG